MTKSDEFIELLRKEFANNSIDDIPNASNLAKSIVQTVLDPDSTAHSSRKWNDDYLYVFSPDGSICQEFDDDFQTLDTYSGKCIRFTMYMRVCKR